MASIAGWPRTVNIGLLLLVTMKVRVWPDSLGGPALIPVAQPETVWVKASSRTVGGLPTIKKLGGWLTRVTVIVDVLEVLVSSPLLRTPPVSWTVTLTFATPIT